jgi:hypothetical protein
MEIGLTAEDGAKRWSETKNSGIIIRRSPVRSRPPLPPINPYFIGISVILERSLTPISFPTFTPRITIHSGRELTVEIVAGDNIGFLTQLSTRQSRSAMA